MSYYKNVYQDEKDIAEYGNLFPYLNMNRNGTLHIKYLRQIFK